MYENGTFISYNPATALYTIDYLDIVENDEDEDEQDLSVYETLIVYLQADYLKHEMRIL